MDILDWLIAFIPILSFGLIPVIGTLIGGKPTEQSMGIALGGFVFSLIILIFRRPDISPHIFIIGFLSGVFWSIGSVGQFMGINALGVSRATPMLNGGQIIGTSILGVMLGDWASASAKTYGFIALFLIIVGIFFTSYKQQDDNSKVKTQWARGIIINLIAVLGFTAYVGILKYYNIDGWSSIFPQSIGQIVAIYILGLVIFKAQSFTKFSFRNSVIGVIWGVGNIALLLSQASLGLSIAYPVSQAAVIVSVFGGVLINKERKTRKEWISAGIGIAIICAGLFMIYLSGKH
ncbi:GRP family sugar transporter [uncultured Bacteroides sp.]|uniref:GRP family sugar transporter n=1 Tax=uncultured Bacteroides sp. TaxID=162156 RepID=UPI0025F94246|nr:GRP family sugar transporter [uncultured Bacteroides sp.]